MRATKGLLKGLNPTMAMTALTVVTLFLLFGVFDPDTAGTWFTGAKDTIIAGFVVLHPGGRPVPVLRRLPDVQPLWQHPAGRRRPGTGVWLLAWFSMLFSAGMGIGLVFWSIAGHVSPAEQPFITEGMTPEAAPDRHAPHLLPLGSAPWAIYVIVGLSLAFFSYRRKLPLAIRSVLYPILGDRIYGYWGHAADVLAVFGTVFGVATSLGLGVSQMNTGLNQMFGMGVSQANQLWLIGGISLIATLSAISTVSGAG